MPDFHHHKQCPLVKLSQPNEIHASEFGTRLAQFDIVMDVDDTNIPCLSSASGKKLATITLVVNSSFLDLFTAFVTFVAFVAIVVVFLVLFSGPLTRCFNWSWTDVCPFV